MSPLQVRPAGGAAGCRVMLVVFVVFVVFVVLVVRIVSGLVRPCVIHGWQAPHDPPELTAYESRLVDEDPFTLLPVWCEPG